MQIKNFKKAARRVASAIKKNEKIILYGDADLDGVTSVVILKEAIRSLGGSISAVYFPDRENDGYGITEKGLSILKKFSPALLISLDCGIGNIKEIKIANKLGFEVIVIDHHVQVGKLPAAKIVVDPKQKGDKYHFKELATAGIAFKFAELLMERKMTPILRKNFLELAAIGTLADMMPKEDENRLFITEGLEDLDRSFRPGIKAFFEVDFLKDFDSERIVSKMISILNVRDTEDNLPASFRLFTVHSIEEAKELVLKLRVKNDFRRQKINEIIAEIDEKISDQGAPVIFEGDSNWDYTLISPVASFLCQKFGKPAFIFKKLKDESQGTVRSNSGIDSVALMKKCRKYLMTFGGHPRASGFRIKNKNLEKFKECLIKNCPPKA